MKKTFFKIPTSRNSISSIWKHFFLGKLNQCFLLYTIITLVILNTEFGLIWTTPWPDEKEFFKILKNSQFAKFAKFRMKTQLFPRHALPIFFCCTLLLHWWYSIPSLVWFGQLLDPMKKNFFKILKKSQFAKFAKLRMKYHFFSRLAIPTNFLLYPLITLAILHTAFGLIWTTPWPDEKEKKNFLRILNNSQFAKFANLQIFVWKTFFFLNKLYQQLLGYTLSLHRWYSMPSLVWFGQLLDPMKKNFLKFSKTRNSRNSQNSVWKPNFFLGTLYQFFFAVHSYYTGDTQYRVWFDLDNSLTRWKRIFLKFSKNRNSRNSQNCVWNTIFFLG